MPYVISTLTDPVVYAEYAEVNNGAADRVQTVRINGGANLVDKRLILGDGATSRPGARTEVTEAEAAFLQKHPVFVTHFNNGFVDIIREKVAVEKAVKNMKAKDAATQLTEDDSKEGGRVQGITTKKPD